MKYYSEFKQSGQSFEDRIGSPTEQDAAMGRIIEGFSFLEDTASNVIIFIANLSHEFGNIITSGMSFRHKLDVISSLSKAIIAKLPEESKPNEDEIKELINFCGNAEELRNKYLHSSYSSNLRQKITSKRKYGLKIDIEKYDSSLLLDVSDYIVHAGMDLELLPILLGFADSTAGNYNSVSYVKGDSIIATFQFGKIK